MTDRDFALHAARQANPRPAGTSGPEGEWSAVELLAQIEHKNATGKTLERETREQPTHTQKPPLRRNPIVVAATAFAVMLLIGIIGFTLVADRGDSDVVTPTPSTEPAPTTVPTTTPPPPTTSPATTAAPTTVPATTMPSATVPAPQVHDTSVTWDGENCILNGPPQARAGDTLALTYQNTSGDDVDFLVAYLVSGSTVEDLDAHDGIIDRSTTAPPPFINFVASYPGNQTGLPPGASASQQVELTVPRVHVVTCFGGPQPPAGDTQTAKSADLGIAVTE